MGTTGTITGVSRYLKEQSSGVRVIGAQPGEGSRIPGIRKWPEAYLPKIYDPTCGRRDGQRQPGRRRGHGAPPGARGGPVRRHLGGGRVLGRAADRRAGRERDHRLHRLRPRRSLSFHRRVSRHEPQASSTSAPTARPPLQLLAQMEDGGEKTRLRCPACDWTHWNNPTPVLAAVIEWPTATGRCCSRATRPGRAACSRSSPASWKRARRPCCVARLRALRCAPACPAARAAL